MRQARWFVGALGFTLLLGAAARAEEMPTPAPAGPCAADIERFCKGIAPGEGRLRTCLESHASELAAECRVRVQAKPATPGTRPAPALGPQPLLACRTELRTHCAGVPSGGGRLRACLQSHAAELTAPCKRALTRPASK